MPNATVVTTSCGRLPGSERPTGTSLPQLAVVTAALHHAGWTVLLTSPCGGPAPVDPTERISEWAHATAALEDTTPLAALPADPSDAWIVLGGPGARGDLADAPGLAARLARAAASGAIVMTVGHGAATLAATPPGGTPLAAGRRVTGRSDAEERQDPSSRGSSPTIEQRLRSVGARVYVGAAGRPNLVVDGHLVTAQNTASVGLAITHVIAIAEPWRAVA